MKKLLGAALALTLGVTCVGALAGCDNGDKDAETAKGVISQIADMYANMYTNAVTPEDYELIGQYTVEGTQYPITWTVNVTEGVTVKPMDETTKKVTVDVNEDTTTDISYELTASITYAGITETHTFKDLTVPKVQSAEEAVQDAISAIKAMYVNKYNNAETARDYDLIGQYPVKGTPCPITWTVNVTEGVTVKPMDENTKKVTIDVDEKTPTEISYKLTASITYGDATETCTFEGLTVPAFVPAPIEEGTYKFSLYQKTLEKTLYFTGEINSSEYGATTENIAEAADVTIRETIDGYTLKVSGKYLELYTNSESKVRLRLVDTPTAAWEYNSTLNVFTWIEAEAEYYLGTYNNYNTISASKTSYISGDNADKVGVSQFVVETVKSIAAGTYKLYLQQANLDKTLYFTGEINSSEYGATTENIAEAADVVVAVVEGGNTLKVGDKYLELYTNSANKVRLTLVDTPTAAWVYNYELGVFTWKEGETVYYLGTYSTYNTISASAISYISGDNADKVGVSQFVVNFKEALGEGTYNLYLQQVNLKKTLYFKGDIDNREYGATTENAAEAAKVVVAKTEGGHTLKVGDKYLEIYTNSEKKVRLRLVDAPTAAWVYDYELGAFTWKEGETVYYLGTYNTYNTISASNVSFISGDNAANVGVTQFVLKFEKA